MLQKLSSFFNANKTKFAGALLVIVGTVQANSAALQAVLSPKSFVYFTIAVGCIVGVFGFLNSAQNK